MAYACPVDLDLARLRREIQSVYARVAAEPGGAFHFHRGAAYAVERLGYDAGELAALPLAVTASFAGIGNPHAIARVAEGATIADVGCGAGMDLLISAGRIGRSGLAIGVDMTEDMVQRARAGAHEANRSNVDVRLGDATNLPVADAAVDVVTSNGVLNLVPDKPAAAAEMFRVLKIGGRLQIADIIVGAALSDEIKSDVDLWTG